MNRFSKVLAVGLGLCYCAGISSYAAQVSPTPGYSNTTNASTPTSATTILNDGSSTAGYRVDCTLQNKGTHTLYYKFEIQGSNTATVTTNDKQLPPQGIMNCNDGVTVDSTALSILGTSGDTYSVSEQFVRGQ